MKTVRISIGLMLLATCPAGLLAAQALRVPAGHSCVPQSVPQLIDVTAAAGIHFLHTSDPTKRYIPESMSGGVLLIDYDRDGWPDIYFTNAPTIAMALRGEKARSALYHNNRDGTFTDVTEKAGVGFPCFAMGGAVGDYNNDGWPDIYVSCVGGNVLYRNNGDGTFTDVTRHAGVTDGRWSTGASFADFDGDGYLDLMVANYVDLDLHHLPQPGSAPTCTYRGVAVQCGPHGLKGAGDVLFHNNGDGTFTDVSKNAGVDDPGHFYGMSVLAADFDGSGRLGIFIANDSTPNYLYRNRGNGTFENVALTAGVAFDQNGREQANMGVTVGDYTHTGLPSIYSTTFSDEYKPLYRNDGHWNFTDARVQAGLGERSRSLLGWGTGFVDLNNDGWLDLLTVYGHVYPQVDRLPNGARYREPMTVFLNQGNGTFCDASDLAGTATRLPEPSRGLALGDLFNDGQMDAVIENIDGSPVVLRNRGVAGAHWINFELAGVKSNRMAIGAEVILKSGNMIQTAQVISGGSYLSQNDPRLHFGLGSATTVKSVEIRWPSGHTDRFADIRADGFYSVLEGAGIVERSRIVPELGPRAR